MGFNDRVFRLLTAGAIFILYWIGIIEGGMAIGLGIVAIVFAITSFVGTCPLYAPFDLTTKKK